MHDLAALANRLRKTQKLRRKWAARGGIEAYRVYDADIPELKYLIDVYRDHAVVYDLSDETRAVTPAEAPDVARVVAEALQLPPAHVHFKLRRRMPGASQYEKLGEAGVALTVAEETSRYLVNLTDYLDTGLFLDHRPLRSVFRKLPPGQRFLNLFCYTGAVSVAAAGAGALTTNVDLSNTYLDWAARNFEANGLALKDHDFVREDALRFLADGPRPGQSFDVVFLDPPTFSNSKRMAATFDVQRDHRQVVEQAMAFVAPGGVLYFSTNKRRFVLDAALPQRYEVQDISDATIPEDFRDRRVHRCFTLRPPAAVSPRL